jgi:alkylhydroperoxidase family enzyme
LLKYDNLTNTELDEGLYQSNELAALNYAEEATKYRKISDKTFSELQKYFTNNEIAEIVVSCAIENYYNVVNTSFEIESDNLSTYEHENSLSN